MLPLLFHFGHAFLLSADMDLVTSDNPAMQLPIGHWSSGTLIASLIWSAIGSGYFIYGKKQRAEGPLFGGIVLVAISYLISSALTMSLTGVGVIAAVYLWSKRG